MIAAKVGVLPGRLQGPGRLPPSRAAAVTLPAPERAGAGDRPVRAIPRR